MAHEFQIAIPYRYTAEVIPPRFRKLRRVEQSATIALTLHSVSAADAPVAIIQRERAWDDSSNEITRETVYRWWRNRLYVRYHFQRYSHAPDETQTVEQ